MNNAQTENKERGAMATSSAPFFASGLIFVSCLGMAGCAQALPDGPPPAAPTVKVSYPLERPVIDYAEFTGRTMAVDAVRLRARVWGHLQKINFIEGADVKKNDLLFVIDQRSYKAALARADAELAQNEARHKRLIGDQKRAETLALSKAISLEDLEKIAGDVSEAAAMVKGSIATRDVAKLNLDFTEVKSPIDGQISRAMITVGNMVESGETGGTILTTIMSTDNMYAYFDVDDQTWEQRLRKSNLDTTVEQLGLSSEKAYPHLGKLNFVDNQIDAGTGTMRMRGFFPNKDRALTPGLFVRIRLPLGGAHNALLVSDRAIDTDQGQKILYVVNRDNVVEKRLVTLGGLHDGLREIESGVKAKEQIVVEGIQRVRAGAAVSPEVVAMPGVK
jgi:RND family efflux transporter MFP subunit